MIEGISLLGAQKVALSLLVPWNPLIYPCWWPKAVAPAAVAKAIAAGAFEAEPYDGKRSRRLSWHVRRIAYLVQHPRWRPISLDVGVPSMGCHITHVVVDGNHRLAAAFYRGQASIQAEIAGEVGVIEAFLRGERLV